MARTVKTEGFILKKRSLLGKDILLTIFTKDLGKLVVSAKGVKKITSRRAPHLTTGNLTSFTFSTSNDRYYLQDSKMVSAFSTIKENVKKTEFLYLTFFVLDRMLPEHQPEEQTYRFLKSFCVHLAKDKEFGKVEMTEYLGTLLHTLGFEKGLTDYNDLIRYIEEIIHEKVPSFDI